MTQVLVLMLTGALFVGSIWSLGLIINSAVEVILELHREINLVSSCLPLLMTAVGIGQIWFFNSRLGIVLPPGAYAGTLAVALATLAAIASGVSSPPAWVLKGKRREWMLGWIIAGSVPLAGSLIGRALRPSEAMTVVVLGSLLYPFVMGIVYGAVNAVSRDAAPKPDLIVIEHGWRRSARIPKRKKFRSQLRNVWMSGWRPYAQVLRLPMLPARRKITRRAAQVRGEHDALRAARQGLVLPPRD